MSTVHIVNDVNTVHIIDTVNTVHIVNRANAVRIVHNVNTAHIVNYVNTQHMSPVNTEHMPQAEFCHFPKFDPKWVEIGSFRTRIGQDRSVRTSGIVSSPSRNLKRIQRKCRTKIAENFPISL